MMFETFIVQLQQNTGQPTETNHRSAPVQLPSSAVTKSEVQSARSRDISALNRVQQQHGIGFEEEGVIHSSEVDMALVICFRSEYSSDFGRMSGEWFLAARRLQCLAADFRDSSLAAASRGSAPTTRLAHEKMSEVTPSDCRP